MTTPTTCTACRSAARAVGVEPAADTAGLSPHRAGDRARHHQRHADARLPPAGRARARARAEGQPHDRRQRVSRSRNARPRPRPRRSRHVRLGRARSVGRAVCLARQGRRRRRAIERFGAFAICCGTRPIPAMLSVAAGMPALEAFPIDAYRRSMDRALKRDVRLAWGHSPTEGLPVLRDAIAHRFGGQPHNVLVLAGAQQGLDLLARCLDRSRRHRRRRSSRLPRRAPHVQRRRRARSSAGTSCATISTSSKTSSSATGRS